MKETTGKSLLVAGAVGTVIVGIDQWSKLAIERAFMLGESLVLIPGFVNLTYVRNPGVAFGLFADFAWRWRLPFFVLVALISAWLLVKIYREAGHFLPGRLALGLILGGAVGNFIDRLRYGAVVDFIDVGVASYRWPTFNVADSGISVGTAILLLALWRAKRL
jgi:signal peptidase II